ncbi:MAG: HIT family protein [Thermodesulfobacteriota bacterium]
MFSNAPENYTCPFCLFAAGATHRLVFSRPADIVYEDERLLAFICARQWPNNRGHVLIIPREHYENIFDLPDALGGAIHALARRIAVAMKHAYRCDGISTRQHNEPHGNQEVYHYHLHVYPRYRGDNLYAIPKGEIMAPEERAAFAAHLRFYLDLDARQRLYAGQVAEPCAMCDGGRC